PAHQLLLMGHLLEPETRGRAILTVPDCGAGRGSEHPSRRRREGSGHDPPLHKTVNDGGGPWPQVRDRCPVVVLLSACPSTNSSTARSSATPPASARRSTASSGTCPSCSPKPSPRATGSKIAAPPPSCASAC